VVSDPMRGAAVIGINDLPEIPDFGYDFVDKVH